MNRNFATSMVLMGALALYAGTARGQEAPPPHPPEGMHGVPGGEFGPPPLEHMELLGLAGMHGGKVVTGAPFSAVALSETVHTLADGTHITRKTETNLFRDSQGRFRKEGTIPAVGLMGHAGNGQAKSFVVIMDPVAGTTYLLHADTKTAESMGQHFGRRAMKDAVTNKMKGKIEAREQEEIASGNLKKEDLGTQTINGIVAQGTRETRTIPAGQIGNDKAITIVRENWYSNDLQMVVMSKHSNPWSGETTYSLTSIQRTEPNAALFSVPSDYTVTQGHGAGRPGMMRRRPTPPPAEN